MRVLLVEDDADLRELVGTQLRDLVSHSEIVVAENGRQAQLALERLRFDLVLSDVAMPDLDGISLLRWIVERNIKTNVVIMSGSPKISPIEIHAEGAVGFLAKPFDRIKLRNTLAQIENFDWFDANEDE